MKGTQGSECQEDSSANWIGQAIKTTSIYTSSKNEIHYLVIAT